MKKLFISVSLLLASFAFSQVRQHNVQPKETIYGISKQYGITQDALKNANPFLKNRELQVGDVLEIPGNNVYNNNQIESVAIDYEDANFYYRVVKPKENVYRLAKIYSVTQESIESLNPFIQERGLQVGDVVRIAKKANERPNTSAPTPEGMYEVKMGDTVYSIAKDNGVEEADIYAANKSVQVEGLKAGNFIRIPKSKSVTIERNWFKHKVQKDETIFSLLRKYDVTLDELLKNNPELNNGLQAGMTLNVPMEKDANIIEHGKGEVAVAVAPAFSDGEINIAWVLPFYLNKPNSFKGERKVSQEFYMGAQLALDELIKKGKKVNVKVIDAQNDKRVLSNFYDSPEIDKYDAIIGPFFQDMVEFSAKKLQKKGIPIFSPVVNSDKLIPYENVYMANPRDEYAADILVEDIIKKYKGQVIKILTTIDERDMAVYLSDEIGKKIKNVNLSIVYNPDDLQLIENKKITTFPDGTTEETVTYQPEIAILVSENNAVGDRFVEVITKQNPDDISGFSLYFVPALDVFNANNAKNIEALKKIGFEYTTSRMINSYGTTEKKVLKAFEDKYCQKPTRYMALGYDVVYDVVDRMDNSGKISDFDAKRSETRLSSKFGYQTVDNGKAKINKEIRVIKLN
ncbi:LysM peptidoglycan-binding domain-containing protein [Weeksellaceae bacterium TAE3-ERU29]|nr:LysM peptidoglycan-binding domain-containing protein [Weeksellaceae bacterium TAE3-ERU29]